MEDTPLEFEKINVLLVDDRPANLYALREILTRPDYNLVLASSGPEALSHLLKADFALILLDVFMPEMDGFEIISIIKKREKTRHIPIIFLTAMAKDPQVIYKAYSMGAVDYIQKPFEVHVVRAKVAVFAELYRKTQQIKRMEIREREHQLQEVKRMGERRYLDLVEGIDHGIVWSADPRNLMFTYVSPRAEMILGYPVEDWLTEPDFWLRHMHPEDREIALERFKRAEKGQDLGFEHRFFRSSGEMMWFHTGVRLARKGEGVGYELRGLSIDITPLKETEGALREAVRARDEFLSIASHELKTPLTPLKLRIDTLVRYLRRKDLSEIPQEQILKIADTCTTQLFRLSQLVDNLLDVSRLRSGKLELNKEKVNLTELLKEVVAKYCTDSSGSQKCQIDAPENHPVLGVWDRGRIEQVLVNLITNAIKYGQGSLIEASCSVSEGHAILRVRDRGIGIAKGDLGRIFQQFERAVGDDNFEFSGLGLGLYIARQLVEAHQGSIHVESELGEGTAFTVKLPMDVEAEANLGEKVV